MKGFLIMEGLLKLVGMKTLYRLGRVAGGTCCRNAGKLWKETCALCWIRPCAAGNCKN